MDIGTIMMILGLIQARLKTIEGIGLYPQATTNYLLGVRIKM